MARFECSPPLYKLPQPQDQPNRGCRDAAEQKGCIANLASLLARAPGTELDSFYPCEICREIYWHDQRQYEVSWFPSVVNASTRASFRSRIHSAIEDCGDGKYSLVKWRDTWENADAWDNDKDKTDFVAEWKAYCCENGIQTPVSPPSSDDEVAEGVRVTVKLLNMMFRVRSRKQRKLRRRQWSVVEPAERAREGVDVAAAEDGGVGLGDEL